MSKINVSQNKRIWGLLNKVDEVAYRADYVMEITNGRETSVSEISYDEALVFITLLLDVEIGKRKPMNPNSLLAKNFNALPHNKLADHAALVKTESDSQKANRLRRTILRYCHDMKTWYKYEADGNTYILKDGKPVLDYDAIDAYCIKYSTAKKTLNEHTLAELPKLVYQFKKLNDNIPF